MGGTTYIDFGCIRSPPCSANLRRNVIRRSDTPCHIIGIRAVRHSFIYSELARGGQSEVADLDIVHAVWAETDEDVVGFQVTMDDIESVNVDEALEDLAEESPHLVGILPNIPLNEIP